MFEINNVDATENNENKPDEAVLPERKIADWSGRDTVFAVITAVCSVIFVSLSLFGNFALGFTVSYFIFFALTVIYMLKSEIKIKPFTLFCGISSVLISIVFAIFDTDFINTGLFCAVFGLYAIFIALSYTDSNSGIIFSAIEALIISPLKNIAEPARAYNKYCKDQNKKGPNRQVILGIVISVPVLAVVLPLLISSDAAFEGLMSKVFSGTLSLIAKIILGLILSVFVFSCIFALKKGIASTNMPRPSTTDLKTLSAVTGVTFFIILSVFYFVYLLSQLAYFFSAFSGILPPDYKFSLADYARRGFFELCGVCSINLFLIILFSLLAKRNENGKKPLSVSIATAVVCFFSAVFTITAISKMFLYINFYGLTRLRLLTSIFMTLLLLLFMGIIILLFAKKFPIAKYVVTCLAILSLAVGFCDIDRTIAYFNVSGYESGRLTEIDVKYLGTLSDSAVPYLASMLKVDSEVIRNEAATALYKRAEILFEIEDEKIKDRSNDNFGHYNLSRERAKALILKNKKQILAAKPLAEACEMGNDVYYDTVYPGEEYAY